MSTGVDSSMPRERRSRYERCVVLTPTRELPIYVRRFTMLRSRNVSYPNVCATKIGR